MDSTTLQQMFTLGKEVTSFTRAFTNGQEILEVLLENEVISAAGVRETRTQKFALTGEVAANLLSSLKVITENLNNLVEKTTKEVQAKMEQDTLVPTDTPDTDDVEEVETAVAETA
jgi:hypothetical protein